MSYLDPKYDEWYNVIGGPAVYNVVQTWYAETDDGGRAYYADEYEDGWFSVDGDEWYGEFPSRGDAEAYLLLEFSETNGYSETS